ncbi:hypothetical protein [Cellulosilyticum ruminicola]|uniref:hypothetical protein n=1 Tax=Cellulosilyticum ruminicola TaxID=425254 RepID=UPI0006D0B2EC|nr:hypothetical protein [Cellulosilyticum ruminicola]
MKKKILTFIFSFIAFLIFAYIQLPVLKLDFTSLYITLIMFLLLFGFLNLDFKSPIAEYFTKISKISFGLSGLLVLYLLFVPFISSTPFFHAGSYKSLLGEIIESEFSSDVNPVSVEDIRLVDKENANNLGVKKLGEVPGLGSIASLGDFHIQNIDGELFWVAPIVHRDFIKWMTNLKGSTGYIMVSATNPQDVRFIKDIDGKPINITYQPNAYLHQDLARHLYTHGFANIGLTDFTLEVNDEGYPYWIVTLYEHKVGYAGADAIGVATVNPATGEINRYSIEDAPSWIDRIQPEYFIENQISYWGTYVNGYLNAKIAEEGVLKPTPGTSLVYGDDGNSYWYTGITSAGADDSTIGFMLVNTRTKEAKLYKQPGATETAAMRSAEGKVQEKGYFATIPVMYNVLGSPTYVISLKDKAGLIKMVALVSVEDYSLVGLGETKQEALKNYKEVLKAKGNTLNLGSSSGSTEVTGKITRIGQDVQGGTTYYYFTVDTLENYILNTTSAISEEITLTAVGDTVNLSYELYGDTLDVTAFDNLTLK